MQVSHAIYLDKIFKVFQDKKPIIIILAFFELRLRFDLKLKDFLTNLSVWARCPYHNRTLNLTSNLDRTSTVSHFENGMVMFSSR